LWRDSAAMAKADTPKNEQERLDAIERYNVLDTSDDPILNGITNAVAAICQAPIALVTIIDADRQYFVSRSGLDATETPRDIAFCAHTIIQPTDYLEVHDTLQDDRFLGNPLVLDQPHIRFYAGKSLVSHDGHALGTLCVIDTKPRECERLMTPCHMVSLSLTLKAS